MRLTRVLAYGVVIFLAYNFVHSLYLKNKPFIEEFLAAEDKLEQEEAQSSSIPQLKAKVTNENPSFIEKKLVKIINAVLATTEGKQLAEKMIIAQAKQATGSQETLAETLSEVSFVDVTYGHGIEAHCGQTVKVFYDGAPLEGNKFENTRNNSNLPITITIGDHQVIRGLEYAIIGMKTISQRRVIIPPNLGYLDVNFTHKEVVENSFLKYNVELIDVIPDLPNLNQLQVFDKIGGIGKSARCGDKVTINVSLSDLKGKLLFSTKDKKQPKTLIIGHKNIPYAITIALEKMRLNGLRSVLTPAEFLNNIDNKPTYLFPDSINFTKDDMLMLEIELLSINPL